jgi:hypothetical protein
MCPAYAKKAGNECKKWAKLVPGSVDAVQFSTGMGFAACMTPLRHSSNCTGKDIKSTMVVHENSRTPGMIQMRAKYSILITLHSRS